MRTANILFDMQHYQHERLGTGMVENLPVVQTGLERLLAMDGQASDAETSLTLVSESRALWLDTNAKGDFLEIARWAQIYSFGHTTLADGRAKWQAVRITDHPYAKTWAEFCNRHLGIAATTASNKSRNWEVFYIDYGYGFPALMRAGVQRLNLVRALYATLFSVGVPENLDKAVFGSPNLCTECGAYVDYVGDAPELCPECGKLFKPLAPKTVLEITDMVQAIKNAGKDDAGKDDSSRLEVEIELEKDALYVVPYWIANGERYTLPVWEIPVLGNGEYAESGGVPAELAEGIKDFFQKKFRPKE